MTQETLSCALNYVRRGYAVLPIPQGQKAPRIKDWPTLDLKVPDLPAHFSNGGNIGLILGARSGGLVDIDLDASEALAVADCFLPQTTSVFGRASKPRAHRLYYCDQPPAPRKFAAPDGTCLVELRSTGQQTIAPPSIHPSGEVIAWANDGEPMRVDGGVLASAVARLATAALLTHYWPKSDRHEARMALGGALARARWSQEETVAFVQSIIQVAQPDDVEAYAKVASDTRSAYAKLQRGEPVTGLPRLAELLGTDVAQCVREWLSFEPKNVSTNAIVEWQEPSLLGDELLPVPAFDVACLPANCRPLVEDVSERMQTPPDYAAAALVVALAGCVGRRASIQPKSLDTSWQVVPNLWGSIIGPPGLMKSPVVQAVTRPLAHIEQLWRELYAHDCEDYEREKELLDLRRQAWKDQTKSFFKKGVPHKSAPDSTLGSPTQKRLMLTDSTPEKLHEILSVNPGGVLVLRDELTGWLAELDRHGRESERAFYLQAWNGDSGFTMDRIGRGSIHVPAACVSLFGNIQPSRLRAYLADAVSAGPGDDGLFQRFQITVWPDAPRKWSLVDRVPNSLALTTAERVFSLLANLSPEMPIRATFAPDAQQLFFEWWAKLEDEVRSESGLHPAMVAHLSKYRSLMPSLALLFELSNEVASGLTPGEGLTVSLDHALQAVALCKYLEGHARRVYACIISPETRAARELARHIRAHDLPSTFATRTVYLKGWSGLDSPERVRGALTVLEDADWVRRVQPSVLPGGGRPSETWTVNPRVTRHV